MWISELSCIMLVAVVMTAGQAPGDEQELCTVSLPGAGQNVVEDPTNGRILMDSSHYERLLPENTGAVWQRLDLDSNNPGGIISSWEEVGDLCVSTVTVCGYPAGDQDNWLFTQHINRTVNGRPLQQVSVQIEYQLTTCEETTTGSTICRRTFDLLKYETSTIDPVAARDTGNYQPIQTLTTQASGSITEEFGFATTESGFYLAIRDPGTCIIISRLLVFYYTCPSETVDLVVRPETIAPVIGSTEQLIVTPACVGNSSSVGGDLSLICLPSGQWIAPPSTGCQCDPGFVPTMSQECLPCEPGFYASEANGQCLTCPNNSNSTESGLAACPCYQDYYRTPQEADLPCTLPPSPPLNLRVINTTTTTVTLQWEEPLSTGGRSRDELRYSLWYRVAGTVDIIFSSTVTSTIGTIHGLSSNVEYEIYVTSETNITVQIPNNDSFLLARGMLTSFIHTTTVNIELIVAVTVSVLVAAAIATVAIITLVCIVAICCKRWSKMTVELTELRAMQESAAMKANPSYDVVQESAAMKANFSYDVVRQPGHVATTDDENYEVIM